MGLDPNALEEFLFSRRSTLMGAMAMAGNGLLPSCTLAHGPAIAAKSIKAFFARLREVASAQVKAGETAGIAVGMSGIGFRKSAYFGFSDVAKGIPVGPETEFRIASVTKPIVAVCALQMQEEGQLNLNSSLSEFYPDFPKAKDIKITDLLQHTSGLANWWNRLPANAPNDFMNRPEALDWLAQMNQPFLFEPGTLRDYSNSGFVVLGKVLEQVHGASLQSALSHYVLKRVGADATGFERRVETGAWATGYQSTWRGLEEAPLVPPPYAAGGLRSTLHDQLAFSDALFLGPLLEPDSKFRMLEHARVADGRRVQDAMYVAPGNQPEPLPDDTSELGYGLGINTWVQLGERFYSHAGAIDGFSSYLIHAPRTGISVSILSNTLHDTADLNEHARRLLRGLPTDPPIEE